MIHHLFAIVLAAAAFDADMSSQEKKNTGIYKLSDQEKTALQEWVDNSYNKPSKKNNPSLMENLYNGSYIRLTDNSTWNIRPQDRAIAQGWISQVEIVITPSGNTEYPSKLTNSVSKSSVLAKKVDSLPNSPSQSKKSATSPATTTN
ncbi:MAG TPA: hypothetical protein VHL30_01200 [Chlamydiales bacterium]|jgi:hypothetical protein|nr:hypothetical protein [Chlamydiales bacterium]